MTKIKSGEKRLFNQVYGRLLGGILSGRNEDTGTMCVRGRPVHVKSSASERWQDVAFPLSSAIMEHSNGVPLTRNRLRQNIQPTRNDA